MMIAAVALVLGFNANDDGSSSTSSARELKLTQSLLQASSHGACFNPAGTVKAVATPVVPNNLLFNHKTNLLEADDLSNDDLLLRANVKHAVDLHPGATVIFDDDASCLELLERAGAAKELMQWYAHPEKMPERALPLPAHVPYYSGKYRSDLCRMAQLFLHGGMYLDTDVQLVRSLAPLAGSRLTTVLGESGDHVFQALVASEPGSRTIRRSIDYWGEFARGERAVSSLVGPDLLLKAIEDENFASPRTKSGRLALRAAGVEILVEARGTTFAREQSACLASEGVYRAAQTFENNCGVTVQQEETGATFAYSRMMRAKPAGDGARSCASAEPPVSWTCNCEHPFQKGAGQNGITCVSSSGASKRRFCAEHAVCEHMSSWDEGLVASPCRSAGGHRQLSTNVTTSPSPPPPPPSASPSTPPPSASPSPPPLPPLDPGLVPVETTSFTISFESVRRLLRALQQQTVTFTISFEKIKTAVVDTIADSVTDITTDQITVEPVDGNPNVLKVTIYPKEGQTAPQILDAISSDPNTLLQNIGEELGENVPTPSFVVNPSIAISGVAPPPPPPPAKKRGWVVAVAVCVPLGVALLALGVYLLVKKGKLSVPGYGSDRPSMTKHTVTEGV